jgi:hypothetical protein
MISGFGFSSRTPSDPKNSFLRKWVLGMISDGIQHPVDIIIELGIFHLVWFMFDGLIKGKWNNIQVWFARQVLKASSIGSMGTHTANK